MEIKGAEYIVKKHYLLLDRKFRDKFWSSTLLFICICTMVESKWLDVESCGTFKH